MAQREFFGGNFNPVILSTYCALSCYKIWKNPWGKSWDICLCKSGPHSGWNYPFASIAFFLGKLHLSSFYLIIVPYHFAKYKKKILKVDLEKLYKIEKFTDLQTQIQIHTCAETNNKSFPLKIKWQYIFSLFLSFSYYFAESATKKTPNKV